jgi:excisionase family DNA binding protein
VALLNKKETAQVLRISTMTVDKLRRAGVLPWRRIGDRRVLFSTEDIEQFIARSRTEGTED